ncbi:hypothetical protein ACJDU8_06715 [Clostridium sp. WILCCON 0269]|uniref:Uncharacterized protein n=1 Tax=Candidatus Clostridium eludens TaxID=3381663 RepID=A0ABW8SGU4_9CLOT
MIVTNNYEKQLSFEEVVEKYTEIPKLIILKTDVQRRGVHYTEKALEKIDPDVYQLIGSNVFFASLGARDQKTKSVPESLILRDGTTIITDPTPLDQNPYSVDYIDGKFVLVDNEKIIEEVDFWEKPDYYGKVTSSGTPMDSVVFARPQRLNITPSSYCYFWKNNH